MANEKNGTFAPKEVVKEFFIAGIMAGLVDGVRDWLKKSGQEVGGKIGERAYKRLIEEKRSELLAFIHYLETVDTTAAGNLFRRQQERQECKKRTYSDEEYLPGDEDRMIFLLTKLYIALEYLDGEDKKTCADKKECARVFIWLGKLTDEEFDSKLEFLNHDSVAQWLKRMKVYMGQIIKSPIVKKMTIATVVSAGVVLAKANSFAGNIADELRPVSNRLADELKEGKEITRKGGMETWFDF